MGAVVELHPKNINLWSMWLESYGKEVPGTGKEDVYSNRFCDPENRTEGGRESL